MVDKCRITVIGGGVAGYTAAIRAARLGGEVTLIEKAGLGGTCLNRGCIPTKSLLHAGEVLRVVKEAKVFGIKTGPPEIDFPAVIKRKEMVVQRLRKGVESLVAARKIKTVKSEAELLDNETVKIVNTGDIIKSDRIILATGSVPAKLPIPGLDKVDFWNSDDFLEMSKLPEVTTIIGGGVIGVELAQILSGFGRKVTILELESQLIPGLDIEISKNLEMVLKKRGIQIITSARVTQIEKDNTQTVLRYEVDNETRTLTAQRMIIAVGRRPALDGIDSQKLGLETKDGAVVVNQRMETNIKGVYAAGDVTGGIMLAHVAIAEGECAAINSMGEHQAMNYKAIPTCIYTNPEVASVGLSEELAKKQYEIEIGRFPFIACGKATVTNYTTGMVKIIADKKHKEVLGVHIIGAQATDMIAEGVLAMTLNSTVEDLARAVHPHPTLSESVMEAASSIVGGAVHIP